MKLNQMKSWNDALALLRVHKEAVAAIAGVFIFLPNLLWAQFVGEPPVEGLVEPAEIQAAQMNFMIDNAFSFALSNLVIAFGTLALYILFSPNQRATVGDILKAAAGLFLFFFAANILVAFGLFFGFILLIIPGFYLLGRLALVPMVVADLAERNPVEAVRKNWELTKNNGWSIFFFLAMIVLVGAITILVISLVTGLLGGLITGGQGLPLLENVISSALGTVFQVVLIAVIAAVYRQLTGKTQKIEEVFN